eukprot:TRINITY_DN21669_c0_g1_i1.p1 TRINITY_DN21669_c0_g1~~TRINITY_DN21669_c0_g1_i1.p1  ORF type:complete len:192 (-),score=32.26 TRINITY_DN21669_c0_g1_i1:15-554(-)
MSKDSPTAASCHTMQAQKKGVIVTASVPKGSFAPKGTVPVTIEVENGSKKTVNMIEIYLEMITFTPKNKEKSTTVGTLQQYFEGSRFPLYQGLNYKGTVKYPIPRDLEQSSGDVRYQLVIETPYGQKFGSGRTKVIMPIIVKSEQSKKPEETAQNSESESVSNTEDSSDSDDSTSDSSD